jgi:hypothetical protein
MTTALSCGIYFPSARIVPKDSAGIRLSSLTVALAAIVKGGRNLDREEDCYVAGVGLGGDGSGCSVA